MRTPTSKLKKISSLSSQAPFGPLLFAKISQNQPLRQAVVLPKIALFCGLYRYYCGRKYESHNLSYLQILLPDCVCKSLTNRPQNLFDLEGMWHRSVTGQVACSSDSDFFLSKVDSLKGMSSRNAADAMIILRIRLIFQVTSSSLNRYNWLYRQTKQQQQHYSK